ncbi:hypothetical protein LSH36_1693g00014 [Paralvinella palmiformis]|uniref:Uncharacterized protein n=1 Tax=Paralvinella palmiformis TaxID=53620 RepID=A0AAD9MM66_9ANNE|nr:hypothetical protein LSH36_1693g00014 [Paralvinella palmiformis]
MNLCSGKQLCHLCHKTYDLDVCYAFLSKTVDERRPFFLAKRLCFPCFCMNHTSKGSLQKRTCNKSNKSVLHLSTWTTINLAILKIIYSPVNHQQ